jgi:hypothetical protein
MDESDEDGESVISPIPERAPSLPLIDTVGAIELPSRIGSEASKKSRKRAPPGDIPDIPAVPAIPRKSSRRQSGGSPARSGDRARLSATGPSAYTKSHGQTLSASRIPFTNTQPSSSRNKRYSTGNESTTSSVLRDGEENIPTSYTNHMRQTSSALGAHGADVADDRPSTVGFVQQHRASDHIHYSADSPAFEASTAEVHGRPGW